MPDSELNSNVRKLNQKQHQLFDIVHIWAINVLKSRSLNPHTFEKIKPLHVFFTENAGYGQSFLMKVIYQLLRKTLSYGDVVIEKTFWYMKRFCLWHQQVLLLYKWMPQQCTLL